MAPPIGGLQACHEPSPFASASPPTPTYYPTTAQLQPPSPRLTSLHGQGSGGCTQLAALSAPLRACLFILQVGIARVPRTCHARTPLHPADASPAARSHVIIIMNNVEQTPILLNKTVRWEGWGSPARSLPPMSSWRARTAPTSRVRWVGPFLSIAVWELDGMQDELRCCTHHRN